MGEQCSLQEIREEVRTLRDNHMAHLAADITELKVHQAKHGAALDYLKNWHWIIVTASVGALVTGILNLISQ